MKKAWKIVLITALCLLILGEIVLGVGLLSGGSPDRVWETASEYYDFQQISDFLHSDAVQGPLGQIGLHIP